MGPRRVEPRRVGGPNLEKVGPRRVARRVGPKISRFFPFSRHNFLSSFPLLGVLSLNFGGVFKGRDPEMCKFGLSGCRVKPRGLSSGGGVQRKGPSVMGCRVRSFGFSTGFWGRKQKQSKNKMKREMSKTKKKVKKSKKTKQKKKKKERKKNRANTICSTSAN